MRFVFISIIAGIVLCSAYIICDLLGLTPQTERNALTGFGQRSLFVDSSELTEAQWLSTERSGFACSFEENNYGYYCGFDIRVGDGTEEGEDLSSFTHLLLSVKLIGDGRYIRINFRNAFEDITKAPNGKQQDVKQPISTGLNEFKLPLDRFTVPQYWVDKHPHLALSEHTPQRNNVTHIGFFFEKPNTLGTHKFEIFKFALINQPAQIVKGIAYLAPPILFLALVALILKQRLHNRSSPNGISPAKPAKVVDPMPKGDIRLLEEALQKDKISELDLFDPTTGLLSRAAARDLLGRYQQSFSFSGMALINVLLEHYPEIKSQYGVHVAAEFRSTASFIIKTCLDKLGIACSWEESQILILMPSATASGAKKIAEKIRRECANKLYSDDSLPLELVVHDTKVAVGEDFRMALERCDSSRSSTWEP